jgi:hypothetical protein
VREERNANEKLIMRGAKDFSGESVFRCWC